MGPRISCLSLPSASRSGRLRIGTRRSARPPGKPCGSWQKKRLGSRSDRLIGGHAWHASAGVEECALIGKPFIDVRQRHGGVGGANER